MNTIIQKNSIVPIDLGNGELIFRKVVELRQTPNGIELILKKVGRNHSERRWLHKKGV